MPGLSLALSDQPGIGGCFVASEPLAAIDHGEFRYTPSLHHVLDEDVHAIERDIRRALKVFHAKQASLKPQVVAARKLAEWIIDRGTNPVSRSIVIGVEVPTDDCPMFVVDTIGLRDDLLVGRVEASGFDLAELNVHLLALSARQHHRSRLLVQAAATGTTAWIDDAARHVVESCGLDGADLAGMLDANDELQVVIGDGDDAVIASFLWTEGVFGVSFSDAGQRFEFHRGALTIDCAGLPETTLALLPGRPLRSLIDHPLLPGRNVITQVDEIGGEWKLVKIASELRPLMMDPRLPERRPARHTVRKSCDFAVS